MLENDITPIFADIDSNGNLDLENLERYLREDTIAVCSVDYAGRSVDMAKFYAFAKKHNLIWISDSSHAFGALDCGRKVGSVADMTIFSFHAVKPMTTCEGGALVCNNALFDRVSRLVCSHGIVKNTPYNHDCITTGFNFRLNELSAALGIAQMYRIENFILKREKIARFYTQYFKDNPYFSMLELPNLNIDVTPRYIVDNPHISLSTHHLFPVFLTPKLAEKKEDIANALAAQNIGVQVHYKPIYNFSLYKKLGFTPDKPLDKAEEFYKMELSLPCAHSTSPTQSKKIADIIMQTFAKFV